MTKEYTGIVKAIPESKHGYNSFCFHDFVDDNGKTVWFSTKKPLEFKKGNKIKIKYSEVENGEYLNRYLVHSEILENRVFANKDDFRLNVDAGNAVEKAKDIIVALINKGDGTDVDKKMPILTKIMVDNFNYAKELLETPKESKTVENTQQIKTESTEAEVLKEDAESY